MTDHSLLLVAVGAATTAVTAAAAVAFAADAGIWQAPRRALALLFAVLAIAAGGDTANAFGVYGAVPWLAALPAAAALSLPRALRHAVEALCSQAPASRVAYLPAAGAGLVLALLYAVVGLRSETAAMAKDAVWVGFIGLLVIHLSVAVRVMHDRRMRIRAELSHAWGMAERRFVLAAVLVAAALTSLVLEVTTQLFVSLPEILQLALGLFRAAVVIIVAALALAARGILARSSSGPIEPEPAVGLAETASSCAPAYARSALDEQAASRLAARLEEAMRRHRLYRDPFLTLAQLAGAVEAPPHKVSQVLNQRLGYTFFDFVNGWRVRDAERRLMEEPGLPFLRIAMEAGFNSRSTFNAALRKHLGSTPTDIRRRAIKPGVRPQQDAQGREKLS